MGVTIFEDLVLQERLDALLEVAVLQRQHKCSPHI
jgi:hypothetical protein